MRMPRIGLITIGQAPRDDIVPDMVAQLGFPVETVQRGAIDGLTLEEVEPLAPRAGEPWSVSRMRDGTEVRLAKRELLPRVQRRIDELAQLDVDLIVPLCASDWSEVRCDVAFINPGRALPSIVMAMLRPGGTLGSIAPTAEQARSTGERYATAGVPVVPAFVQPYTSDREQSQQCVAAGRLMAASGVDLIYMGCMGHTRQMRALVREVSGRPTITANGVTAGLITQALA